MNISWDLILANKIYWGEMPQGFLQWAEAQVSLKWETWDEICEWASSSEEAHKAWRIQAETFFPLWEEYEKQQGI